MAIALVLFLVFITVATILEKKKFWKWLNRNNPFTFLGWFWLWVVVVAIVWGGFLFWFGIGGFV